MTTDSEKKKLENFDNESLQETFIGEDHSVYTDNSKHILSHARFPDSTSILSLAGL